MEHVLRSGIIDGIWYVDNTKRPAPEKARNYVRYSDEQQSILNNALRDGVTSLALPDPRHSYPARANLETMEHTCSQYARAMKLTDRTGRLFYSWDCMNEDTYSISRTDHISTVSLASFTINNTAGSWMPNLKIQLHYSMVIRGQMPCYEERMQEL